VCFARAKGAGCSAAFEEAEKQRNTRRKGAAVLRSKKKKKFVTPRATCEAESKGDHERKRDLTEITRKTPRRRRQGEITGKRTCALQGGDIFSVKGGFSQKTRPHPSIRGRLNNMQLPSRGKNKKQVKGGDCISVLKITNDKVIKILFYLQYREKK